MALNRKKLFGPLSPEPWDPPPPRTPSMLPPPPLPPPLELNIVVNVIRKARNNANGVPVLALGQPVWGLGDGTGIIWSAKTKTVRFSLQKSARDARKKPNSMLLFLS